MDIFERRNFFNDLGFFTLSNAAPELGNFFGRDVMISNPRTEILEIERVIGQEGKFVHFSVSFNEGRDGNPQVILREKDALKLASFAIETKLGEQKVKDEWDELHINAVEEVVNILAGNVTEVLTVVFGRAVEIEVPELEKGLGKMASRFLEKERVVVNNYTIYLGEDVEIEMKEVAKQEYYENLVDQLKKRV